MAMINGGSGLTPDEKLDPDNDKMKNDLAKAKES